MTTLSEEIGESQQSNSDAVSAATDKAIYLSAVGVALRASNESLAAVSFMCAAAKAADLPAGEYDNLLNALESAKVACKAMLEVGNV